MSNNTTDIINVQLIPTLDTSAYGAGDTLFATTKLSGAPRAGIIRSITMIDKDDVASESATFYFLNSNVTFGTFNATPSISDTDAVSIVGVSGAVVASVDLGGCKIGTLAVTIPYEAQGNGLYVAATTATALTHTASGLVINFVIERWI